MRSIFLAVIMTLSLAAFSQEGEGDRFNYQLNYYSHRLNALAMDQTTRIINPGTQGTPISVGEGTICADMYVFDANQELSECCACIITANGIREFSLLHDLTANPLTGTSAPDGVIKIVADSQNQCDPTDPRPVPDLLAWQTHVQQPTIDSLALTEDMFKVSRLTFDELAFLGRACSFTQYLGSGKGVCGCGLHQVG